MFSYCHPCFSFIVIHAFHRLSSTFFIYCHPYLSSTVIHYFQLFIPKFHLVLCKYPSNSSNLCNQFPPSTSLHFLNALLKIFLSNFIPFFLNFHSSIYIHFYNLVLFFFPICLFPAHQSVLTAHRSPLHARFPAFPVGLSLHCANKSTKANF